VEKKRPLILVTNDDGVEAKGFKSLIEMVKPFGEVVAVAPFHVHSGKSHSITVEIPVRYRKMYNSEHAEIYGCTGTPVDSVKLAFSEILHRQPDLIVSGINHGSNASVSVLYSGTMGAVIEGCINGINSVGFSLLDFHPDADFTGSIEYGKKLVDHTLKNGLPDGTCLNVNVPAVPVEKIKGIKICRQAKGVWREEFEKRLDPRSGEYFWLTGYFENHENGATDTDEWALANGYVSVVPIHVDLTDYEAIERLKKISYD
jgi:5'-nucleotidase